VVWAEAQTSDYFFLLQIIFDEPVVKDIITANLMTWPFWCQIMYSNIAIPALVAKVGLAEVWKFQVKALYEILGFHLSRSEVELHSLED